MPKRPAPVKCPAGVHQILQPLQGSVEQAAPPTMSSSEAGATSGATVSGNNASQSSSQENATGSNVSNNSTMTLEVFSYNVLVLYSSRGLLVIPCCLALHLPRLCFFPVTREPVFRLRDGSTWSAIDSVGLSRIQFLLKCYIMFPCCARLFSFLCRFLLN